VWRSPRAHGLGAGGGLTPDAAEADVAHAGVDHLRTASRRPVAQAVGVRTEIRTALDHLAGNLELGLSRVVALLERASANTVGHATARARGVRRALDVPVGGPFPDVAGHVMEAVAVR